MTLHQGPSPSSPTEFTTGGVETGFAAIPVSEPDHPELLMWTVAWTRPDADAGTFMISRVFAPNVYNAQRGATMLVQSEYGYTPWIYSIIEGRI